MVLIHIQQIVIVSAFVFTLAFLDSIVLIKGNAKEPKSYLKLSNQKRTIMEQQKTELLLKQ
jgi:hypothetical protein